MKNVMEIVTEHLRSIGADGLCRDGCGCGLGDLMPCEGAWVGDPSGCVPARKEVATETNEWVDAGDAIYVPMDAPDAKKHCPYCEIGPGMPVVHSCCVESPDGSRCTRAKGHDGPHVACGCVDHELQTWENNNG